MKSICWPKSAIIIGTLLLLSGVHVPLSSAADPELVGVLALAVRPEMAQELGLNEEQLDALNKLISAREAEALDIASEMRKLPSEERVDRMRQLVRELEQKAFRELTIQQRGRLERMRLSKLGLVSLAESEVAETLGLSEGQKEQIRQAVENRGRLASELGADAARIENERRLRSVLTGGQWATWQSMAGQAAKASPAASPGDVVNASNATAPTIVAQTNVPQTNVPQTSPTQPKQEVVENKAKPQDAAPAIASKKELIAAAHSAGEKELTINFNKVPWEDVLQWMAKEAELSLQYDTFPIGTFTYRDPYRTYTVGQALDIMNGVLLNKAYRLIRRQRSLMVIDLGNGESAEVVRGLLRELAELVTPEELDKRGEYELLKCLFLLSRLSPEEAQKEITLLMGPEGSAIPLGSSGQILVTETGGKLRLIRDMLKRVEDPDSSRGSKIVSILLQHVSAEEVLGIARPLLGLADGVNQSTEFNVSTDTFGNTIFATGTPDKLQLLRDLAMQIDVKPGEGGPASIAIEHPTLESHSIRSSDPTTAYNVLQTLLDGSPNVRLSLEPKTNSIVALGAKADHKLIDDTLAKLAGESSSFTVIPLHRIEVQTAIATLEKFFGKPSTTAGTAGAAATGPIFIGDAMSRTLMVKGSPQELIQVKELLTKLEDTSPELDAINGTIKVFPMTGKTADRAIEQIQYLWDAQKRKNRIRIKTPEDLRQKENNVEEVPDRMKPVTDRKSATDRTTSQHSTARTGKFVSTTVGVPDDSETNNPSGDTIVGPSDVGPSDVGPSDIVIFRGPSGLVVTCDDPKALAEFEQVARFVADQMMSASSEPTVYYLKYITAKSADELIRSIIAGEASSGGGGGGAGGGLLGNMLGEMGGGLVGGLLGLGGGGVGSSSTTSSTLSGGMTSGEISITADPRLNCLLVSANAIDLDLIEQLLKIIDIEDSPIQIETQGKPQVIQVVHNDVEEIATIVKQVFADRIAQSATAGGGGGQQRQPSPQDLIEALRGGGGGGGGRGGAGGRSGGQSELKPQTMTIGTDKKNNALIVTASQSLFEQVQALVVMLDEGGAETEEKVEVVQLPGSMTAEGLQKAMSSVFGSKAKTSTTAAAGGSGSAAAGGAASGGSSVDAEAAQRRAEFFQALQRSGVGGGGPGGGTRGGTPGGGGPGGGTRGGGTSGGGTPGGGTRGGR